MSNIRTSHKCVYTLACDCPNVGIFVESTQAVCMKIARAAGWKINPQKKTCKCPKCSSVVKAKLGFWARLADAMRGRAS